MKTLILLLTVMGLLAIPGHIFSQAALPGMAGEVRFLDLPDGFGIGEETEGELDFIEFYAEAYEGDAFFFCLDRSGSMREPTPSGASKYAVMIREVVRAIQGLSSRSVVTVHFYDASMNQLTLGDPPIRMDAAGKAMLISRVSTTPITGGSCMLRGMEKTLAVAGKSQNEHRTIILVADGRTHCANDENDPDKVFQRIMARNRLRIPINGIYVGPRSGEDWNIGMPLLRRLSLATNGRFKIAN